MNLERLANLAHSSATRMMEASKRKDDPLFKPFCEERNLDLAEESLGALVGDKVWGKAIKACSSPGLSLNLIDCLIRFPDGHAGILIKLPKVILLPSLHQAEEPVGLPLLHP